MYTPAVEVTPPSQSTLTIPTLRDLFGCSRLGRILSASVVRQALAADRVPQWASPTFEVVYNLHKLAEFPAYMSEPTSSNDEPWFWNEFYNWPTPTWSVDVVNEKANTCLSDSAFKPQKAKRYEQLKKHKKDKRLSLATTVVCDLPKRKNVRFHQVTPEDAERAERSWKNVAGIGTSKSVLLRDWAIDARRSDDCRICDEKLTDELLMRGSYICAKHSGSAYAEHVIASRSSITAKEQRIWDAAKAAKIEEARRTTLFYEECECLTPEQCDRVRHLPLNKAIQYVAACKRWGMEKAMVAKAHPNAPYEARPFSDILQESRTFPN